MIKKIMILMGAILAIILVVFVLSNSGTVNNDNNDEQVVDALRVGVHYDVKNMGYHKYYDEDLSGFEVDFAKQLAKNIYGKESLIELTPVSSKTAEYLLANKTVDCIVATQTANEKNDTNKYSNPYYTDYIECIYINGSIVSVNDLSNKKIGIIADSVAAKRLESALKDGKISAETVAFQGVGDGMEAMESGKIDAFCTNRSFVSGGSLKRFTVGECKYVVVVRKEDKELLEKINATIEQLEKSGELKTLQNKYK